jgi:hypothetical protein
MNCLLSGTEMSMYSRGLAVVLAEDIPAIAETQPPCNSHLPVS